MAVFTWVPSWNSELQEDPRILETRFGDGYAQRTGDGINHIPMKWNLSFDEIPAADGDAIRAFLRARGGYEAFDWTPPGMASARFVCKTWKRRYAAPGNASLTAVFEQDFAP